LGKSLTVDCFVSSILLITFLGTEFKNLVCRVTGCMVGLELQRGKEGMRVGEYCDSLGATAACTLHLTGIALEVD
jgi:hypothetical protein